MFYYVENNKTSPHELKVWNQTIERTTFFENDDK